MPESIYIETTIPSLYVARPSTQLIEAARQQLTKIWWDEHRANYDLVCSQTVIDECGRGEALMAEMRLAVLDSVPLIELSEEVITIAEDLVSRENFPDESD